MKVELTEQEWLVVLNAMSLAPYREVQPMITKISDQLVSQKQPVPPEERKDV